MKVTHEVKLDLSLINISRHVRSNLAKDVEKYWVGRKNSNIGLQYLRYKNGVIKANEGFFERKDLLMFQLLLANHRHAGFNLFYEPYGGLNWNLFDSTTLDKEEMAQVERWVKVVVQGPELASYLDHERRFLEAKPWLQVDGMTPEDAVAKFKELGWY